MSEQRHRIKRQVIELHAPSPELAQRLQAEVSRVYRQRIVPLIDQLCSELGAPDQLYRIDTLEVDLGHIDPHRLEEELVASLGPAFRTALAAQINEQQRSNDRHQRPAQAAAQLELLAFLARTGSLPWWADAAQPHLLDESLRSLIESAPEALRRLLRQLAHEQRPLRRIISHYPDGLLARLTRLLAPVLDRNQEPELQTVVMMLQEAAARADQSPTQRRQTGWDATLSVASLAGGNIQRPPPSIWPYCVAQRPDSEGHWLLCWRILIKPHKGKLSVRAANRSSYVNG